MKRKHLVIYYAALAVFFLIFWYFSLFPLNLRDPVFFLLMIFAAALILAPFLLDLSVQGVKQASPFNPSGAGQNLSITLRKGAKLLVIPLALVVLYVLGLATGLTPFQSRNYAGLITMEDGNFQEDITEIEFYDIPTIDRETAIRLGNKKMGEMAQLVSQFDVAEDYTQINYLDEPVRVTPLAYDGFFKWLGNRSEGIPNLVTVNLVSGEVDMVPIEGGMRYSESEYLLRNIHRHVRFRYPTAILGDAKFEIDENAVPHWIFPVLQPQVGWFSGRDVTHAIIVNAATGAAEKIPVGEIPEWVDRAYPSEMIMEQLDDHGQYQDGWFNSFIGQRGVLQVTDGYNYLALNDDVFLYTGITSVSGDSSNLGFVLVNQRTKDTRFYAVSSADEMSAMRSAEGAVQQMGYYSTFPILLNINGRPTYCMALKDNAALVKMYALVDAQNFQSVATGTTILDAQLSYENLLQTQLIQEGLGEDPSLDTEVIELEGVVTEITQVVIEGNTSFYLRLEDEPLTFVAPITLNPELAFLESGQSVTVTYRESQGADGLYRLDSLETD